MLGGGGGGGQVKYRHFNLLVNYNLQDITYNVILKICIVFTQAHLTSYWQRTYISEYLFIFSPTFLVSSFLFNEVKILQKS